MCSKNKQLDLENIFNHLNEKEQLQFMFVENSELKSVELRDNGKLVKSLEAKTHIKLQILLSVML